MAFGKVTEPTTKKVTFVKLASGQKVKTSTYERLVREAQNNNQTPPKLKSPESRN